MKKTLIAVAALAATSAFAQVSLSGDFAYAYVATTNAGNIATGPVNGSDASGLGMDTAQLYFSAKEDLGGGQSIAVNMTLSGGGFASAITNDDLSLAWTTSMGVLAMGSTKGAEFVGSTAGQGLLYNGFDAKVHGSRSARDSISFTVPVATGLTMTLGHAESAAAYGAGQTGGPATSSTTGFEGSRINSVTAKYTAAPLMVVGSYLDYLEKGVADKQTKNVLRLGGTYDFGFASFGLAAEQATQSGTGKIVNTGLSVKVPVNAALTIGAYMGNNTTSDSVGNTFTPNGTKTGQSLTATYAMAKNTRLIGQYQRWDYIPGAAVSSTQSAVVLEKLF